MHYNNMISRLEKKIRDVIDSDILASKESEPIIDVDFNGTVGIVRARFLLNDDESASIREKVASKMENDVFLVSCLGYFTGSPRTLSVSCGVINEDGMPVSLIDDPAIRNVNARAGVTRENIASAMEMA